MQTIFIIGDVHGCFYTLKKLLDDHWNKNEKLIFIGDLIDRGNYSYKVIEYLFNLKMRNLDIEILLGNHEFEFLRYMKNGKNDNWMRQVGEKTIADFNNHNANFKAMEDFIKSFKHKWENDDILITHAGVSDTPNPFVISSRDGIVWNRNPLINIGKTQVKGHTPVVKTPIQFHKESRSWNIDSGACFGYYLTGLRLNLKGEFVDLVQEKTLEKDIPVKKTVQKPQTK